MNNTPESTKGPQSNPELAEDADRKTVAAIMRKMKKGKRPTEKDRNALAGIPNATLLKAQKKAAAEKKTSHMLDRALFWGCKSQQMYRMITDGVPVDDVKEMLKWHSALTSKAKRMLTPAFRVRLNEERSKLEGVLPGIADTAAEEAEFEKGYKPGIEDDQDNLAELKREQAFYLFRMKKARLRNDYSAEEDAAKQYRMFSDLLHDCELRAKKLGKDMSDLVPRGILEHHGRFIAYHLLRCADGAIEDIVSVMAQMGCALPAAHIRNALEPILLSSDYLEPYYRASEGDNQAAPPPWLVAAFKSGAADVLEQKEEQPKTA